MASTEQVRATARPVLPPLTGISTGMVPCAALGSSIRMTRSGTGFHMP